MRGKIYDEPESPNEGACLRYMMKDEAEARNEGACLTKYMMSRNRQMRGACLRYMMIRNRQMRGRVYDI